MKIRMGLLVGMLLSSWVVAVANELPKKVEPVKTVNTEFKIEAGVLATSWTLDTLSTVRRFQWCDRHYGTRLGYQPDCLEGGGFFNGTRDAAKIMGAWAAVDIAAAAVSYEWKRHVRNRYLHPLWRVPLIVGVAGHTRAAIKNWSY